MKIVYYYFIFFCLFINNYSSNEIAGCKKSQLSNQQFLKQNHPIVKKIFFIKNIFRFFRNKPLFLLFQEELNKRFFFSFPLIKKQYHYPLSLKTLLENSMFCQGVDGFDIYPSFNFGDTVFSNVMIGESHLLNTVLMNDVESLRDNNEKNDVSRENSFDQEIFDWIKNHESDNFPCLCNECGASNPLEFIESLSQYINYEDNLTFKSELSREYIIDDFDLANRKDSINPENKIYYEDLFDDNKINDGSFVPLFKTFSEESESEK